MRNISNYTTLKFRAKTKNNNSFKTNVLQNKSHKPKKSYSTMPNALQKRFQYCSFFSIVVTK